MSKDQNTINSPQIRKKPDIIGAGKRTTILSSGSSNILKLKLSGSFIKDLGKKLRQEETDRVISKSIERRATLRRRETLLESSSLNKLREIHNQSNLTAENLKSEKRIEMINKVSQEEAKKKVAFCNLLNLPDSHPKSNPPIFTKKNRIGIG